MEVDESIEAVNEGGKQQETIQAASMSKKRSHQEAETMQEDIVDESNEAGRNVDTVSGFLSSWQLPSSDKSTWIGFEGCRNDGRRTTSIFAHSHRISQVDQKCRK